MTAGHRPRKSLGQHWLTDRGILERISAAADFDSADTVIEIGAGKGALTRLLAPQATRLILVEVDPRLAAGLREEFAGSPTVSVLEADVLETPVTDILQRGGGSLPYVVTGNLPYFIGSPIVRKFVTDRLHPRWMVVMLQEEVARRMAASPGSMGYLSVETQVFASARVLFTVPPKAFRPPPKVRSAVLRLDLHASPDVEVDDTEAFLTLVRAGFAAPRKQLRNSLATGLTVPPARTEDVIRRAGLDPSRRPQELSLDDWRDLYIAYRQQQDAA
jgi:16S rRNA (adenine1518-N6/adenine1519-N6)-dimethyltransferase